MEIKFYFCAHCKNVAIKVVDHKVPLFCCGEKMTELAPGTVDAAKNGNSRTKNRT